MTKQKLQVKHVKPATIKPLRYTYYCREPRCKNILATSDEEPPDWFIEMIWNTPCSKCDPISISRDIYGEKHNRNPISFAGA